MKEDEANDAQAWEVPEDGWAELAEQSAHLLGVPLSAPDAVWRKSYKALCLLLHPDNQQDEQKRVGANAEVQRLQVAWDVVLKWQQMRQRIWEEFFSREHADVPVDALSAESVVSSIESDDDAESASEAFAGS
ncbi:MAG: hypothetical protein ACKPKO_34290, partial [Candidatus Fonsibacter sp.]